MLTKMLFVQGDLSDMAVDAIVYSANTDLTMGAGVTSAVRRKAGERLQEDCERLAPVRLGAAAVTTGGNLPANFVIHAACMRPDERASADSIRLVMRATLMRAEEKALRSIAFSPVGAGEGGIPLAECASIMLKAVLDHIKIRTSLEKIYFVLADAAALKTFTEAYQQLTARPSVPVL